MLLDEADFVHRASIVQGDLSSIVANSNVKAWFLYNRSDRPDRRDWIGAIRAIRMVIWFKRLNTLRTPHFIRQFYMVEIETKFGIQSVTQSEGKAHSMRRSHFNQDIRLEFL